MYLLPKYPFSHEVCTLNFLYSNTIGHHLQLLTVWPWQDTAPPIRPVRHLTPTGLRASLSRCCNLEKGYSKQSYNACLMGAITIFCGPKKQSKSEKICPDLFLWPNWKAKRSALKHFLNIIVSYQPIVFKSKCLILFANYLWILLKFPQRGINKGILMKVFW